MRFFSRSLVKYESDDYQQPNTGPLSRQFAQLFSRDEVRTLCLDLSVDPDEMPEKAKTEQCAWLIETLQRAGRLPELLSKLQQERPQYDWQKPTISTPKDLRNRDNLLQSVKSIWIDGYLHISLSQLIKLELQLSYQPEAIARKSLYPSSQSLELSIDQPLQEVFHKHGRSLLILGEPGSGKTITMLQLAESLLATAQDNPSEPVPVILNLSSWAEQKQLLQDWLVEELFLQYGMPRKLSRTWIAQNLLLYLLDGLDEVSVGAREACVQAINNFKAEFPAELVVCSRLGDYETLQERLNVAAAVRLHSLTDTQIRSYLDHPELELTAVYNALNTNSDLLELAKSPLFLNIMTLAYRGFSSEQLESSGSVEERRDHLFKTYVQVMFDRKSYFLANFTQNQIREFLTNLAFGMKEHSQSIFYIERLQPTWLTSRKHFYKYVIGTRLAMGVMAGLVTGLGIGLYLGFYMSREVGIFAGLAIGILFGVIFALTGMPSPKGILSKEILEWKAPQKSELLIGIVKVIRAGILVGLLVGLLGGSILNLTSVLLLGGTGIPYLIIFSSLSAGLLLGINLGITKAISTFIKRSKQSIDIQKLSNKNDLQIRLVLGTLNAIPPFLLAILLSYLYTGVFPGAAELTALYFLLSCLLFLLSGKIKQQIIAQEKITLIEDLFWRMPKVNLLLSKMNNGLLSGFIGGFLFGSVGGFISGKLGEDFLNIPTEISFIYGSTPLAFPQSLFFSLTAGLLFGVVSAVFFGGVDGFKTLIQTREVPQKINPNQGILRSRKNALRMGLLFSAIYGVLNIFILGTIFSLFSSLYWQVFLPLKDGAMLGLAGGLRLGLLVGVIFGFLDGFFEYGGTTLLQHHSLRYELMKSKALSLPFFDKSLINLFNETEKFIFMRQVGGGWVFIHRTLLDFFAAKHLDSRY